MSNPRNKLKVEKSEGAKSESVEKPKVEIPSEAFKVQIKQEKEDKMALIGHIENFVVGSSFVEYELRLKQYFIVNNIKEDKKVAYFIILMGPEAYSILSKMCAPDDPSTKDYDALVKVLKDYFQPQINEISESYKFYSIVQRESSVCDFIMRLKSQANKCNFGDHLKRALRDKFVCGLKDGALRAKLLQESKLTFKSACETAISWEIVENENKDMGKESNTFVNAVRDPRSNRRCYRCGRQHDPNYCPARDWECFQCLKRGHISTQCPERNQPSNLNRLEEEEDSSVSEQ